MLVVERDYRHTYWLHPDKDDIPTAIRSRGGYAATPNDGSLERLRRRLARAARARVDPAALVSRVVRSYPIDERGSHIEVAASVIIPTSAAGGDVVGRLLFRTPYELSWADAITELEVRISDPRHIPALDDVVAELFPPLSPARTIEQTLSRVVTRVTGFDDTSDEGDDAPGAAGSR